MSRVSHGHVSQRNVSRSWGRALLALAALGTLACGDEARVIAPAEPQGESMEGAGSGSPPEGEVPTPATSQPGSSGAAGSSGGSAPFGTATPPVIPTTPGATDVPAPAPGPTAERVLHGACDIAARIGGFSVEAQVDFGVVQGAVADAVLPTAVPRLVTDNGTCRVLERRNLACIPACTGSLACGESGSCIPYPRQIDVGVVDIAGLTRATSMTPLQPGNTYFSPGADNPPYASDARILLSAQGGTGLAAFELAGHGSEPLRESPRWQLARGTDLSVTWAPPSTPAVSRVLIQLTIDQHGQSPLSLSCELEDTGSAVIPAALIDQLIDAGVSGFPNGQITRRTADHVQLEQGCVDLVVGSPRAADVSVAGFTPCNVNAECPVGQACNTLLQRCE